MPIQRNAFVSTLFRVIVSAGLLLVAIGFFLYLRWSAPKPAGSDVGATIPRVQVMLARPVAVRRPWQGFGTASAMDSANVPSRVTSTVIERPENIRPGQVVQQGQLIARLDESDFARQVEIASQALRDIDAQLQRLDVEAVSWSRRAELATEEVRLAQVELDRIQQALQRDAARQREVDQIQRALFAAQQAEAAMREGLDAIGPRRASLQAQRQREEASLRLASQNLERSTILSPLEGVLQSVDVEVGENITAGQRVARVVNAARIEVPLLLPASARPHIEIGNEVTLFDAGETDSTWKAHVSRISPEDDATTRTMRVFVEVHQSTIHHQTEVESEQTAGGAARAANSTHLPPGRFVQGTLLSSQSQQRWVVPRRAIENQRILLVEDGKVKHHTINVDYHFQGELPDLGLSDRQWAVLSEPLPANALVVVDASRTLAEGSPVIAIQAELELADQGDEDGSPLPDRAASGDEQAISDNKQSATTNPLVQP